MAMGTEALARRDSEDNRRVRRRYHPHPMIRRTALACGIAALLLPGFGPGMSRGQARGQAAMNARTDPPGGAVPSLGLEEALDRIGATDEQRADLIRVAKDAIDRGAPAGLMTELARRALEKGIGSDVVEDILRRADALALQDLPPRPVLDRCLQGIAKGVPFERIGAVCDQIATQLREAARTVNEVYPRASGPADSERHPADSERRRTVIDHAAYAMGAGIPADILRRSLRLGADDHAPLEESASSVLALGLLASGGIPPEGSLEVVSVAWQHGYRDSDLEKLGCDLGSLGRPGEPPSADVIQGVLAHIRDGEARERVLDDLEALRRTEEMGHQSPGGSPGEDPTHMHGPGGPPEEPDHQGRHMDGGDHEGHR